MPYLPVTFQDFSGGWNPKWSLNATQLADNQSPFLLNTDYTSRFAFTKRRGFARLGDETLGTGGIKSLYTFRKTDGTEILIRTESTTVKSLTAGIWTNRQTGLTADQKFDFEVYKNKVYWGNGVDNFTEWDGAGAVVTYGGNPKGNIFASAFLRLWVAGVSGDLAQLHYSAVDDFANFAGGGAGTTSFQYAIKNLIGFFDREGNEVLQVILLNGDLYHVGFDSSGTLYKRRVRRNVGSINSRAAAQVEDGNFVLDIFRQVRSVGYQEYLADIRSPSKSVFIDSYLAQLDFTDACSAYINKNFILAAKEPGASSNNTAVLYDENYSSWRLYQGFGANDFAIYQEKLTYASSSDLNVYQFDSTKYSDDGIVINSEFQTKDWDFGKELDLKTCRMIKIGGLISRGCILTVRGYYDANLQVVGWEKTINGDAAYVSQTAADAFGTAQFATIPFAGLGGTTSTIPLYPFMVVLQLPSTPFETLRVVFSNGQEDVDFVISHIKPYVEILAGSRILPNQQI